MDTVRPVRRPLCSTTALALVLGLAPYAAGHAAQWEFSPRVLVSQSWTDNVTLAPSGSEESEWVTELRPGFSLLGVTPRTNTQFDYDAQALWFADNSDFNDVYHQASAQTTVELVQRQLFLEGFLRYDQQYIDPAERIGNRNLFRTDNQADAFVFSVAPYHVGRWGAWGESVLRVQRQGVRYSNYDRSVFNLQDTDTTSLSGSLGSPAEREGVSWRVSGSSATTEFDSAPDFAFDQVQAEVGIPVGLRTRLTAGAGFESDVIEDREGGGLDESTWFVGALWEPTELQTVEGRVGERYYGTSYEFRWLRRGARGNLSLSYTEEPTTSSGVLTDGSVFDPDFSPGGRPRLDDRVFLRKRFAGHASYEFTRTTVSTRLFAERRIEDAGAGSTEHNRGIAFNVDWAASERMRFGARADFEQREFANSDREDDTYEFSVRASRELTRTLTGDLTVGHRFRNSESSAQEYDATWATISLLARF